MNADCFFAIGKTHTVCQDYARTGTSDDGTPYAILADGCSTAPDSDIGARLLVRAAEFDLKRNQELVKEAVIARATAYASTMNLNPRCLDATLLALWADAKTGDVFSAVFGDGYVVGRRREDCKLEFTKIEYPSGAPEYLSYFANAKRHAQFSDDFGDERIVTSWVGVAGTQLENRLQSYWPASYYDMIAVFSDGAGTFQKTIDGKIIDVDPAEIITLAFDVKPPTGPFVVRSGKWLTSVWCRKNNAHFNDDFSMAAINLGPLSEETKQ